MSEKIPRGNNQCIATFVRRNSTKKLVEMRPSGSHKQKITPYGHIAGRWTRDEHMLFIKGI